MTHFDLQAAARGLQVGPECGSLLPAHLGQLGVLWAEQSQHVCSGSCSSLIACMLASWWTFRLE